MAGSQRWWLRGRGHCCHRIRPEPLHLPVKDLSEGSRSEYMPPRREDRTELYLKSEGTVSKVGASGVDKVEM